MNPNASYGGGYTSNYPQAQNNNLATIPKKYLIMGGVVLLGLLVLLIWAIGGRSGTLEITAARSVPKDKEVTVQLLQETGKEETITLKSGETKKVRLPKGQIRVNGSTETQKSIDVVAIKARKTTKLEVPSGEVKSAVQLGSGAEGCPQIVDTILFSYNCGSDGAIRRHNPGAGGATINTTLFAHEQFTAMEPYKKGVLAVRTTGNSKSLVYIDLATGNIQPIPIAKEITTKLNGGFMLLTTNNPNDSKFVLSFPYDKIYLYKDSIDTQPKEVRYGPEVTSDDPHRTRSLSFNGDKLIIYTGGGSDPHDGTEESTDEDRSTVAPGYIFEYDTEGKLVKTVALPAGLRADSAHKLKDNYYAIKRPDAFEFYYLEGNALRLIYDLNDVANWLVHQSETYIQVGGTLYKFIPREEGMFSLHSIFTSETISVNAIFSDPSGILITGLSANDQTSGQRVYRLSDKAAGSNPEQAIQGEPRYKGFELLIEEGISTDQVGNLKVAVNQYIASTKPVSEVTISDLTTIHSRTSDTDTATFTATVGDKILSAKMEYSGRKTIRLYLVDPFSGNKQVFDSGKIGQ